MATFGPVEVLLLGTGGPRGWPEPGCTCASCSVAITSRTSRAPACALLDDALLIDGYEGMERAAAEAGRDLSGVRHVLLTGASEGSLSWLTAVGGTAPLQVHGAAGAREWLRCLSSRIRWVAAAPGGGPLMLGRHEARAAAQGPGLAWDVKTPDGGRLLYAAGSGPVQLTPAAARDEQYDLVLLGLGSGSSAARVLAQLRREGVVAPATDVRALGYSHDADLPDVLQHHLAAWGVAGTSDGAALPEASDEPDERPRPSRTLVLGGVRSGKSALAEQLLASHPDVTYVATGGSREEDSEWQQRVALHRARRPAAWRTLETTDLTACLRAADRGAVLVDCLGTWLTAVLDRHGVWEGGPLAPVDAEVEELLAAWQVLRVPVVAVSNEVGSGVVPATASGRLFRDLLGRLNACVARESESVLLTVAGIPVPLRDRTDR